MFVMGLAVGSGKLIKNGRRRVLKDQAWSKRNMETFHREKVSSWRRARSSATLTFSSSPAPMLAPPQSPHACMQELDLTWAVYSVIAAKRTKHMGPATQPKLAMAYCK